MNIWQKQISFKSLVIGIVVGVVVLMMTAYYVGVKEVASLEAVVFAALIALFLVLVLKHYEIRRRKESELFEELKRRQKSDK